MAISAFAAAINQLADERGWQIAFIPHPNMQRYLDNSPLPSWIRVHRFSDIDVQEMLVSGGALVTDYSSLAFEMAYLERPVVYFQFDQERFFNGGHAYRRGSVTRPHHSRLCPPRDAFR